MAVRILTGDVREQLRTLPSESVACVVTSPPYLGLRSYGTEPQVWGGDSDHQHDWQTVPSTGARSSDTNPGPLQHAGNQNRERLQGGLCACGAWRGELGQEPAPGLFVAHLVEVFEEVRRVLRPDGVCFVNLGDSYANDAKWGGSSGGKHVKGLHGQTGVGRVKRSSGVPAKSLFLIPQRFAIAMQEAGWIVRDEIVWAKKSAMPESVRDRCTKAWEPIYMFTKQGKYFWDQEAVRQPAKYGRSEWIGETGYKQVGDAVSPPERINGRVVPGQGGDANLRNVWHLSPEPSREAHFASYPTEIPRRCILAASRPGDTILDPFLGTGTTLVVADRLGRNGVGVELNPAYVEIAERRIRGDAPLFADIEVAS